MGVMMSQDNVDRQAILWSPDNKANVYGVIMDAETAFSLIWSKIVDRINELRAQGKSYEQIGKRMGGVNRATLSRWASGERGGQRTAAVDLLRYLSGLDVDVDFREMGFEFYHLEEISSSYGDTSMDDYAFIPKAEARLSAGDGLFDVSDEKDEALAFRRDWLSSRTISSEKNLVLMSVDGDSMSPTLTDGDTLLIDRGDHAKRLIENRIYAISYDGKIYVKRYLEAPGKILFKGDNDKMSHKDIEIQLNIEQQEHFSVLGRVIWAGKEL